jgi:hypothetical protein
VARLKGMAVRAWRRGPLSRRPRIMHVIRAPERSDLPQRLDPHALYLVGLPEKWATFDCPCGTGHVVELNLLHPERAHWTVRLDEAGGPSLHPSVDVRARRRCHFWLGSGRVRWCPDRS